MTTAVSPEAAERFRSVIARRLGLRFEDAKLGFLAEVLARRLDADGHAGESYLEGLEVDPASAEIAALGRELTIGETYFFRHTDQFRAFVEVSLPHCMRAQACSRKLRLLSAGCASGEEAYSLAMLVREHVPIQSWDVSILGVDINPAVLEKAARARFSAWALRETPPDVQQRWFRKDGRDAVLDDAVRTAVRFEQRNLIEEDPELWPREAYDVVFCRNVMMYFTPESAQALIDRIARALVPGGYLFLGHAETLCGLSSEFHLRHTHGTFYYQRKEHLEQRPHRAVSEAAGVASFAAIVDGSDAWVDVIQRASERVRQLTQRPPSGELAAATGGGDPRSDVGFALELLQRERFADALERLNALPRGSERDPDVLLLRAVLLTHGGHLAQAERTCRELLAIDELSAGAHYVLALCREGAGDRQGAVDHDQVAVYLDPAFAMPRLHLGLLARRRGDGETARRELGQALEELRHEDASRLLLFGSGFSREALIALCRAELVTCGGAL